MSSEPPKPGAIPGWGAQPPDPPTSPTPAPAAPQAAPGTGAIPGWGQPQAPAPADPAVPAAPAAPGTGAVPGWGQPQPAAPAAPDPATPIPAVPPTAGAGAVPGWGQPAAPAATPPTATPPAPAPAMTPPAAHPGWGSATPTPPVPQAPAPTPPAQPGWGAPGAGAPGAGAPGGTPPGGWNPQPVQASGSNGCLKIILILVVIAVIGFTLLIAGLWILGNRLADSVGVNSDGSVGKSCTIIDNATLSQVLGPKAEAIQLDGLWDATIGIISDKRVLPDAYDCWVTADESTPLGRIAKYTGSDAAAVFQQELKNAQPTSQDQGNGVSLENPGYFAGSVQGLGDEAFCTGISTAIQAGVLVRKGDTLIYVSLSGPGDGSGPSMEPLDNGVIGAPAICQQAVEVARKILP